MKTILSLENISKTYPNNFKAVSDLSFSIQEGEFFALLGTNGAGKTTTLNMISTLIKPTGGTIKISGFDIKTHAMEAKRILGVVPQEVNFNLFEKVLHTLVFFAGCFGIAPKEARILAEKLLKRLYLWKQRDQRINQLSGGMKRRLMIVRALMSRPKLLLLDEPTAGVDIEIRQSIWEFIREINQEGVTIILTTHYLEEAEALCDQAAFLQDGKLTRNEKMSDLLASTYDQSLAIETEEEVDINKLPLLPQVNFTPLRDRNGVMIHIKGKMSLNSILKLLLDQNLSIKNVEPEKSRLESIFLSYLSKQKNDQDDS